jgi:hypothetical protein
MQIHLHEVRILQIHNARPELARYQNFMLDPENDKQKVLLYLTNFSLA